MVRCKEMESLGELVPPWAGITGLSTAHVYKFGRATSLSIRGTLLTLLAVDLDLQVGWNASLRHLEGLLHLLVALLDGERLS